MMTIFGPVLTAVLLAQAPADRTVAGTVVDDQRKPVDNVQVIFHASAPQEHDGEPVEVRTETDTEGRFSLATPPLGGIPITRTRVWAYRLGSAITAMPSDRQPLTLVLRKPEPKTVKIEGPDGQPVAGVRVSPHVIFLADGEVTILPDTLAASRTVTTGSDGRATFNYLAARDRLVAARVAADSVGTQDFTLIERPLRDGQGQGATITIRLKPTSRLAGRVRNRAGQPVADQAIEVWCKGGSVLGPSSVGFKNGPLRTGADGSFQTPDNLLVGSPYRVVVRAPGMEPILSDWVTIGDKLRVLLPMIQRPLRTINGRVVDRQGKPVLGVEVFQSGDGPERTATRTATDGRFALGGFRQGPVFLFVRGEGFRFFGRLIKPGDRDITVELTRTSERPTHPMPMLADPIPQEESRALARRLLAMADPVGVLGKLEEVEFPDARTKSMIQLPKDFPVTGQEFKGWVLWNIAFNLAADNPAEAERILRQVSPETVRDWFPPTIAWKMATVDPARAQRLTAESQRYFDHPQAYLFLALGLKSRDEVAAHQAFQTAMHGIDRLMKDGPEYSEMLGFRGVLLPMVEQIDPALVPELFWRAIATRPSVGNPRRRDNEYSSSALVMLLAWYDRDVAATLFEP